MVSDRELDDETDLHGSMETRYNELQRKLPASTKWLSTKIFRKTLRKDLERDNRILTELLDMFGAWDSSKDSKVNALVDLLRGVLQAYSTVKHIVQHDQHVLRHSRAWQSVAEHGRAW